MTRTQQKAKLNKVLSDIPSSAPLQEWIDAVSKLHEDFSKALEGIYCGREGKIHEELHGDFERFWLDMGWYTVADTPRVEFAYIS
jgi:hypothetical protein